MNKFNEWQKSGWQFPEGTTPEELQSFFQSSIKQAVTEALEMIKLEEKQPNYPIDNGAESYAIECVGWNLAVNELNNKIKGII